MQKVAAFLILLFITGLLQGQSLQQYTTRQTPVHDPVLIKEKGRYYLFGTGYGISVFSSCDLKTWRREKPVFEKLPQWAVRAVTGYNGHAWAPDISYHNGQYYLYYSVSVFGKNTSCIGLATNKTLDPGSPDFNWKDQGQVICSVPGSNNWNAIDPNLVIDERGAPWLAFGSFWDGIQLAPLNTGFTKAIPAGHIISLARRSADADSIIVNNAIEAPFIFRKGGYFYLFVSWDYCCRGKQSNYKVAVGRSACAAGPYFDRNNRPMERGGGTPLIEGDGQEWMGIGHNAVFTDNDGTDYFIAHGYDGQDKGRSRLIIRKLGWDAAGWPFVDINDPD